MHAPQEAVGAELEKRYGIELETHPALFDTIWQRVAGKCEGGVNYVESVLAFSSFEEAVDDFVGAVEDDPLFQYFFSAGQAGEVEASSDVDNGPPDDEPYREPLNWRDISIVWDEVYTARAEAFSEYVAKILNVDPHVMRFRRWLSGDPLKTLSRDEANILVSSLASHFFDFGRFRKLCIPLAERQIVLEELAPVQEDGQLLLRATLSVDPPGVTETLLRLHPSRDPLLTFVWPWGKTERPEVFEVWPNSVLGQLHKTSIRLAKAHPWTVEDAALFILTGEPVFLPPLAFRTHRRRSGVAAHKYIHDEVTLSVAPWVPGEVILEAYRKVRRSLGYKDRRPSERQVALFRFVLTRSEVHVVKKPAWAGLIGQWRARLRRPRWKELRREWNERYPVGHRWHYGQKDPHAKHFQRDFVRAQEKIIGSPHGLPGIPSMPMTVAEEQRMVEGLLGAAERADSQQRNW